jgi:type IV pilus assembly protein PilM
LNYRRTSGAASRRQCIKRDNALAALTFFAMRFDFSQFFRTPAQPLAGVSFGTHHMRWVELDGSAKGPWVLKNLAQERYAAGLLSEGMHIQDMNALAAALQRLAAKSGSRTRRLALCLPASAMMSRRVSMPWLRDEEAMRAQVEQESAQHIPYALDEIALDWSAIGRVRPGRETEVLICATKREVVEDFQVLCEIAGFEPVVLADESQALAQLVELARQREQQWPAKAVLAYVHVSTNSVSHIYLIQHGLPLHHVRVQSGDLGLLDNMARRYGCSVDEARAMRSSGNLPNQYEVEVIKPFVQHLSRHLSQELRHTAQRYGLELSAVFLGGGAANLTRLKTHIAEQLSLPCNVLNPFADMAFAPDLKLPKAELVSMALGCVTATGLALRRFDLPE